MAKIYTLTIEEVDGDNEPRVIHTGDYNGMCILAEHVNEEGCGEILVNTSIPTIAAMMDCSKKVKVAASMMLAATLASEVRTGAIEDMLSESIDGGIQ